MSFVRVRNLRIGTWDVIDSLHHECHNLNEVFLHCLGWLLELDRGSLDVKRYCEETLLKLVIWAIVTPDDLLWRRVLAVGFAEATEELYILVDRVCAELTSLVAHESGDGVKECLGLVSVQVLKLLTQDINGAVLPVLVQEVADALDLRCLVLSEDLETDRLVFRLEQVDKESVVVLVIAPDSEKLEGCLGANAEGLAH